LIDFVLRRHGSRRRSRFGGWISCRLRRSIGARARCQYEAGEHGKTHGEYAAHQ